MPTAISEEERKEIKAMGCRELVGVMVESAHDHNSARRAYDISDVIEENNLDNPDPVVFNKEVSRKVLQEEGSRYHTALQAYRRKCMEGS